MTPPPFTLHCKVKKDYNGTRMWRKADFARPWCACEVALGGRYCETADDIVSLEALNLIARVHQRHLHRGIMLGV